MNKKSLKIILTVIIAILAIILLYFIYVFATYYRVADNYELDVYDISNENEISTNQKHRIISANLGFGAYSDDYSFFMDGGTESWAFNREAVIDNITGAINSIANSYPDIMLLQEVDIDATRSYHVEEDKLITKVFNLKDLNNLDYTFAQNYDSPFLFYPLTQPHGKSVAGIMTFSKYNIENAVRRSLPIEEGFSKLIDLDRCYSKNYISTDNGKKLVVYNVHLSAYTTDPTTAERQVIMLNEDMLNEVSNGNYVIAGGDMNKDLLNSSSDYFNCETIADNWAQPFPIKLLDSKFTLIGPLDKSNPVPSCRNANEPYTPGHTLVLTVDGFIVSDNVEVVESKVINNQFKYSDHNPVYLDFILK